MFQTEVLKKIKTHTLCSISFLSRNGAVYKIMWKNMVEEGNPQTTVYGAQKMPFAFRVTRASIDTHTHTQFSLGICSFSRQKRFANLSSYYVIHTVHVVV